MTNLLGLYHSFPSPLRSVAASLRGYYLRWWRYGTDTPKLIELAGERESWSAEHWNVWQQNRLSFILDYAVKHVPYYREFWAKRKRDGDRCSHAYLENWPVLKKEELRQSPELFLSDQSKVRNMFRDNTSGSTGTPIYTYLSRKTLHEWYALFEARIRVWHGVSRKERWAIMGGQLVVPFVQRKPPFWVYNTGLNQLYLSTHHLSSSTAGFYIQKLIEFQPSHMIVYPSSAAVLADTILDLKLSPPQLKVIFSNAELLTDMQRGTIEKAFGCKVVNTYGMGEYLVGASECVKGSMHFWPEMGFLEVFDDEADIPIGNDNSGRFVVTSLLNADMPLIRYDTGDRGKLRHFDQCDCGISLPCIDSLDGRSNDLLVTKDGRKVFWINPVFYGLPLREAQIIQESLERIVVRYVPSKEFAKIHRNIIVERLQQRLGNIAIILEAVEEIPRSPNGKFRAVVSNINTKVQ